MQTPLPCNIIRVYLLATTSMFSIDKVYISAVTFNLTWHFFIVSQYLCFPAYDSSFVALNVRYFFGPHRYFILQIGTTHIRSICRCSGIITLGYTHCTHTHTRPPRICGHTAGVVCGICTSCVSEQSVMRYVKRTCITRNNYT